MTDVKDIVHALVGVRKAGDISVLRLVDVGADAPREHFVRIALMGDIEDDLVARRIKDRVECDGRFDDAEVRRDVPADAARAVDERRTHLLCENASLLRRVAPYVCGLVNGLKIQGKSPPLTHDNTHATL